MKDYATIYRVQVKLDGSSYLCRILAPSDHEVGHARGLTVAMAIDAAWRSFRS